MNSIQPPATGTQEKTAMTTRYRLDGEQSLFSVQAFVTGMLSFMGHSPTFAVTDMAGEIWLDPDTFADAGMEIRARADSLELMDKVSPTDRKEIEDRMRREVLRAEAYPDIQFRAEETWIDKQESNPHRLICRGALTLHGVTNRLMIEMQMQVYFDGVRLTGEFPLRLSDFDIKPVTALGGAIKLQDQLRVVFDLVAWKEEQ